MNFRCSRASLTQKVKRMSTRKLHLILFLMLAVSPASFAQINCASSGSSGKLSCLVPSTVTPSGFTFSNSSAQTNFAFLTADIGGEISQIPLASPASGIIFTTDPTLHVPVPSDQSLGPILTQRPETIGRHKVYVAATYQYFLLEDVDGLGLKGLPATFLLSSAANTSASPDTVAFGNSRIDLKVHQFVGYVTFGLTSRIDVSAAVPILRVDMRYTVNEQLFNASNGSLLPVCGPGVTGACTPSNPFQNSKAQESTGVGDVVLAVKGTLWKRKHGGGLAAGAEFRLPSGDAQNFLGSGTFGAKPFAAFAYGGRVSPHVNVGYQFNGNTVLVATANGGKGSLPNRLIYSGGADWRVVRRFTLAADVLAQRVFDAPRAAILTDFQPISNSSLTIPRTISTSKGTYNRTDGSIGFKAKPFGRLLLTSNLLIKLDRGGLRERLAPLFGASYTF
jgi:hypothetical protein